MIKAKRLKFLTETEPDKSLTGLSRILKSIKYAVQIFIICPVVDNFDMYKERISRSFAFAKFGWFNFDFDSAFLFKVMEFKLRRIQHCLEHGHALQEKEDMHALKEAIKICSRIHKGAYEDKYFKDHDKKYGSLRLKYLPAENGHTQVTATRSKKLTPKQKKQEIEDFKKCYELAEQDRLNDFDRLNEIFKKYSQKWCD